MAGFGGLFNYEKPGPGIDKNAPKKKGIALFWEIFSEKFWSFIPLSLLYWLLCLPVVTVGLADVGITYITRNYSRHKPVFMVSDFFATIKKNWKQALPVGLVNLLVTAVLLFAMGFYYYFWETHLLYKIGFAVAGCVFIVFSFLKYYINFLVVTFNLSFKQLYRNSLLLSSAGLKENLIITGALLVIYGILFGLPLLWIFVFEDALITIIMGVLALLFLPAIQFFIIQFCVFPVIKKHMIDPYYEVHPEEAKQDKVLLNLFEDEEEEETDESGEETVFTDRGSDETPVESQNTIPKQYSKRDMKQMRKRRDNVDDDTI